MWWLMYTTSRQLFLFRNLYDGCFSRGPNSFNYLPNPIKIAVFDPFSPPFLMRSNVEQ